MYGAPPKVFLFSFCINHKTFFSMQDFQIFRAYRFWGPDIIYVDCFWFGGALLSTRPPEGQYFKMANYDKIAIHMRSVHLVIYCRLVISRPVETHTFSCDSVNITKNTEYNKSSCIILRFFGTLFNIRYVSLQLPCFFVDKWRNFCVM